MNFVLKGSLPIAMAAFGASASANLVTNGDFEQDWTGWSHFGYTSYTYIAQDEAHGKFADFGNQITGGIEQQVAVTNGELYHLEFDLENTGGSANSFNVYFGEATPFTLINAAAEGWHHYSVDTYATVDDSFLTFAFANPPGYWNIDNISLTSAVPEPASLAALAIGGVALIRRRRN